MELKEKIDGIVVDILKMLEITIKYLNESSSIYLNSNILEIPRINDDKIDELERNIEQECLRIILKERPFASDLRKVTGIFKLVEDVERLGDHAEDLIWTTTNLLKYSKSNSIESLKKMFKVALSMVNDSYVSFEKNDDKLANDVIKRDDIVDELYIQSLKDIPLKKEQLKLSDEFVVYSTLLAKYIERIADHASNIAEWVIYIKTGFYKDKMII